MQNLKQLLDREVEKRNRYDEVSADKPDPILIARETRDEFSSLICALFAYGNAKQIVKFLQSLDFSLIDFAENIIKKELEGKYYRFQNENDIINLFIALRRIKQQTSLKELFLKSYYKKESVLDGISSLIELIYQNTKHHSAGFSHLVSKPFDSTKTSGTSPLKRYHMFLRWMVRDDNIDFGLWREIKKSNLIIPLDTHTFHVSQKLGLLKRKTYDLKSAVLLTKKLKEFDENDPVKYDFALYRIGQEKTVVL